MPAGVSVLVQDGFVTIDFVDKSLRGPGLQKLLEVGGPSTIESITRGGPRKMYRVPEGNAREAGLLDDESEVDELPSGKGTSGTDATGMVNPEGFTSANQVHGPVLRQGTYRGGDNGNVDTVGSDPLPADIAAKPHADLVSEVGGVHLDHEPQGVLPGSVPPADKASPFIGMKGVPATAESATAPVVPASEAPYPDGEPSKSWSRAELDAYALDKKQLDTSKLGNKDDVLAAIAK